MAVTEQILMGVPILMVNGQEYALPPRACYVKFSGTAPTVAPVSGGTFAAITDGAVTAGGFIKSGAADTRIVCKAT